MKNTTKTPRFDFVLDSVLKEMAVDPSTGITTFAASPSTSATNPLQPQLQAGPVGQPTIEQQPQAGQQPGQVGPVIQSQDDPFANINIEDPTVFEKLKLKLGTSDPAKFSELLKRLMN